MRKPDFRLCEKLANKLLAQQNITSSKIDVIQLKYDKCIVFDTIQNYCEITSTSIEMFINEKTKLLSEGCTVVKGDVYIVLYNDKPQCKRHLNWTLAHEIGHIYHDHKYDSEIQEIEAHFFAAQLLMPEYVIYMMFKLAGNVNENDIYTLFNASMPAVRKRLKTYHKKFSINKSYNDEKIWSMMKGYIENYYLYANASDELKRFLSIPMTDI